jgi:hypothetical protein
VRLQSINAAIALAQFIGFLRIDAAGAAGNFVKISTQTHRPLVPRLRSRLPGSPVTEIITSRVRAYSPTPPARLFIYLQYGEGGTPT